MTQALLIEIGVEELPAVPLLKIVKNIEKSWTNILAEYNLSTDFEFVYTPRRLVLRHADMQVSQEDATVEFFGPPVVAALKDGEPTKAAEGFSRKCGVPFEELGRGEKNGKEVLYFKKEEKGAQTVSLLQEMLEKWIDSMSFGKMMRWGARTDEFIRPIRWLQVRMDDSSVDVELFGVKSDTKTYVHRMVTYDAVEVANVNSYESILSEGAVMLQPKERESKILAEFDALESTYNIIIERDKSLISEVVAITENPKALVGTFDELFLELPPEVIITSMKEHQRYFPVIEQDGGEESSLLPYFIVVRNGDSQGMELVIEGNEHVIRARFADADFFVQEDALTPRRVTGILLGFLGVLVLIGGDALSGIGGAALLGQLAVLIATMAYAANAVYTRSIPAINTLVVATGSLIIGSVLLLPFTLYFEQPSLLAASGSSQLATLALGVISTGLATWVYFRVVTDCGPTFLSIINYIIPAIAFGAGVLFLGEAAAPSQFLGLVFILLGIALTQNRGPAMPLDND